jgi:hypothetical protein
MLSPGSEEAVGERQSASPSEEMGVNIFRVTTRSPPLRPKLMEIPCSRSWGAMRRNSLPNLLIVFGQRSERVARDFYDRFIELLGFARPADSGSGESDQDGCHGRILEQRLCRLFAAVLVVLI